MTSPDIATHLVPLSLGQLGATPWAFSPAWFVLVALGVPGLVWLGLAWKRALDEDPHRLRRSGLRELRRLLARMRRSNSAPRPAHLHGWCQAAARTWGIRVSTPTGGQVTQSLHTLTGDNTLATTWRELWSATERGLYAADATAPSDWLDRASAAAARVTVPKRERWLPNRLAHWVPSAAVMAVVTLSLIANVVAGARQANAAAPNAGSIADPNSAPAASTDIAGQTASAAHSATATTSSAPPTDQKAALTALHGHWNDWAAHYNIAAAQIQDGNWNYAVAHAAAAFLLHPSDANNRDNLRYAIQQAGTMDPTLRRLLYGAWFQQLPGLLSSAGWQRLALAASLLLAAGLTAIVFGLYVPGDSWVTAGNRGERDIRSALRIHWPRDGRRALKFASRSAAAVGLLVFLLAVTAFNAYGVLSQPNAGILLAGVNVSPSPTELVPEQETFPTTAGSVVVTRHAFLGWHQISAGANISGWIRGNAVMPFYAPSRH